MPRPRPQAFPRSTTRTAFDLRAVDVRDGKVLPWSPVPPTGASQVNSAAVVAGNVIAASGGSLVAFDEHTAARRWTLRLRNNGAAAAVRGLAVLGDRLFAVGAFARNIVELDPRPGDLTRWHTSKPIDEELYSVAASPSA